MSGFDLQEVWSKVHRAIADHARTIRVPVHMIETMSRLRNIGKEMLQELGREWNVTS